MKELATILWTRCRSALLAAAAASLFLPFLAPSPGLAQGILGGGLLDREGPGGSEPHVTWKVTVEPATIAPGGRGTIVASYRTAKGWHIYAPDHVSESGIGIPTRIAVSSGTVALDGGPSFPAPIAKKEELFNEVHRYLQGEDAIRQAFTVPADAKSGDLSLEVAIEYMSCDAKGCDPPAKHSETVALKVVEKTGGLDLTRMSLLAFCLLMIGGGLITLAMPCTYPMIPITFSFFAKLAETRKSSVLPLSLAYGGGIIAVFVLIGVVSWAAFELLRPVQMFASSGWLNAALAVLFVVLALSLLGVYNLRLPAFLQGAAGRAGSVGGYAGVFALGTTLVVTSFTCTAPVLGAVLAPTLLQGSLFRVVLGMAVFGATMALPFVLLSLAPGKVKSLPRSGEWMHTLKVFLGLLEIAAAVKFLQLSDIYWKLEILTREVFMVTWSAIFLVIGLYLLGLLRLKDEEAHGVGHGRLFSGLASLTFALYSLTVAVNPAQRLGIVMSALAPPYPYPSADAAADGAPVARGAESAHVVPTWTVKTDLDAGLAAARAEKKRALLNFTGAT
jgi:thiol:disulfide interchange protein DsbD